MTDSTDGLTYWKGRLEYVIGLDDGDPDGRIKDRFVEELRAARTALGEQDNDALTDWLQSRHLGYLVAVRVWTADGMARMLALADTLEADG